MKSLAIIAFVLLAVPAYAQTVVPPDSADTTRPQVPATDTLAPDTLHIDTAGTRTRGSDTILFVPPPVEKEVPVTDTVNLERRLQQNPTKALFKSLLIPGWGQVGNGKIWKAAVVVGLDTWFVAEIITYNRQAKDWKQKYQAATDQTLRNQNHAIYLNRKHARTKYLFFLGVTTLVSIFDAYVDAQLSGSPIEPEKKNFDLSFVPDKSGVQASVTYRF